MMNTYLLSFCEEFDYPMPAREVLLNAYDEIAATEPAFCLFQNALTGFFQARDTFSVPTALAPILELTTVHRYVLHLLFYICLSKRTRTLYEEREIDYSIFYDSMSDLKWKLQECHQMYGIWGTFVAPWFDRFFDLTRFALGRLQFETVSFERDYEKDGYILHPGDIVLNIHIPSCGPLTKEACFASYAKAKEFYKELFVGRPTVFTCHSWLLYPKHREFLPLTSHILRFMDDFDILTCDVDESRGDLWRIFNQEYHGTLEGLPNKTSLQRAYLAWMAQGNEVGGGYGVRLA